MIERILATIAILGSIFAASTLVWLLFVSEVRPSVVIDNQHVIIHLLKRHCPLEHLHDK